MPSLPSFKNIMPSLPSFIWTCDRSSENIPSLSSLFADRLVIYCGKTLEIENGVQVQPHFNTDNCRKKWYDLFTDELELADINTLEEATEDEPEDKEEVDAEIWPRNVWIFI